jgi:hypothetical protein
MGCLVAMPGILLIIRERQLLYPCISWAGRSVTL